MNNDPSSTDDATISADEFIGYIDRLYGVATDYSSEHDPNLLVLDFLRHKQYNDLQWTALVGGVDKSFVAHAENAGIGLVGFIRDPMYGFDFKIAHFAASCTGIYKYGNPEGDGTNRGDVAAWGGDWITFYGNWRSEHREFPSGRDYCGQKLMKTDVESTFEFSDLMADADGYNVAMRLRAGEPINDVIRAIYDDGGHTPRIEPWFRGRFADEITARAAAGDMLVSREDELIKLGRALLIDEIARDLAVQPDMLAGEKLDGFCQGFTDVALRLIAEEQALLATRQIR